VQSRRDYLTQSALIVFSVLLALGVSELTAALREQKQTAELLANVRTELSANRVAEQEQHRYHVSVLQKVEAALADPQLQRQFVSQGELKLELVAPDGILFRYLNDAAWEVAKSRNVAGKIDARLWALLTRIYADQARIMKVEDEVGRIVLSAESRKPENARQTLVLIRDNYKGWAVDRAPALLKRYDEAIAAMTPR
jgi:type II secretory pathway pseudopilin PulG